MFQIWFVPEVLKVGVFLRLMQGLAWLAMLLVFGRFVIKDGRYLRDKAFLAVTVVVVTWLNLASLH